MKLNKIELWISNFEQTVRFYEQTLGFERLDDGAEAASFRIGSSVLRLNRDPEDRLYYYHFAFNIPPNLFREAKRWLSERAELLLEDGMDEVFFDGMTQADSFYTEDPAGNIVEFIARRETTPASEAAEFDTEQILCISEIGLSVEQVAEYAKRLDSLGIPVRGNEEISYDRYLNFMGEYEDGSFIILAPLGRRWYFSSKLSILAPLVIHTDRGTVDSGMEALSRGGRP
ncbi:hypothetical protein CDO73_01655 [Saccharibacillus sp. O23]|uniref:VOC family protein n=1 Tax=Saccharibacillus sp. O23 TaxID=2009338 RepID=UPI000B4E05C2|nr:VOC family protein [Saccharibacillus sp. O23]OWR32340.1 hypothetical protein CDO73_01655 [Saccharibacillus sp. O23]